MISYDRDDRGIVTLTLDMEGRRQNVWNRGSLQALRGAIERLAADKEAIGAVFTSGKRDFLAGGDLDDLERLAFGTATASELYESVGTLSAQLRSLETCGKPVVAAINGTALGGGFELCLACHHRIVCDEDRIKLGLPEATLGLLPAGGGTQRLPRLIGVQKSLPLLMEGKQLRPREALAQGVVDSVVPSDRLIASAKAWILEPGS